MSLSGKFAPQEEGRKKGAGREMANLLIRTKVSSVQRRVVHIQRGPGWPGPWFVRTEALGLQVLDRWVRSPVVSPISLMAQAGTWANSVY